MRRMEREKEGRRKIGASTNSALHMKRNFCKIFICPILIHLKFCKSIILVLSDAVLKYGNYLQ